MKLLSSWSGGKDSCYAFIKEIEKGHQPVALLNVMNENGKISRSHGITLAILEQQAKAMNLALETCKASWENYEETFINKLKEVKNKHQLEAAVFGDIDIESHKAWEEKVCNAAQLNPLLPLWQGNRRQLVIDMINKGIKAIIVSCNTTLGKGFLGREIDLTILDELEVLGVDCCGENGEYHTLVVDCPIFKNPINLPSYQKVQHENYCFITWN